MPAGTKEIRQAVIAIVNGDATLQSIMGRASDLITAWENSGYSELPIVAYQLLPFETTGENGNSWAGWVSFSMFAEGDGALIKCEDMKGRLIDLLDWTAFDGQGLDAASIMFRQMGDIEGEDREQTRALFRQDLEVELRVFYP
jgi:hypothetical protein